MHRNRLGLVVVAAAAVLTCSRALTTARPLPPAAPVPTLVAAGEPIAGTYEVLLCRTRCAGRDSATTVAVGRLALFDPHVDTAALRALPESAAWPFSRTYMFVDQEQLPNGCFVWTHRRPEPPTYATIHAGGLTRWLRKGDSIFFAFYRSPDAGHEVRALVRQPGFSGQGESWGAGMAEVNYPADLIEATRAGPPDHAVCQAGARAQEAELRRILRDTTGP